MSEHQIWTEFMRTEALLAPFALVLSVPLNIVIAKAHVCAGDHCDYDYALVFSSAGRHLPSTHVADFDWGDL